MNVSGLGSFSLDGVIYRFEALNPLEAVRFGNRVFKVFGPALLSLAAAKKDGAETAGEGMLAALAPALSEVDDDKVSLLINHKITEKEKRDNLGRRGIYFWQECNFVAEYVIEKEWGAPPF